MTKPTGQEMTPMKKQFVTLAIPRERGVPCHGGHTGKRGSCQDAEGLGVGGNIVRAFVAVSSGRTR